MAKLLKIVTVASTAVLLSGFASADIDHNEDMQSMADGSVTLAVAPPPPGTLTSDPSVDLVPSLPTTPPMPQRTPDIPTLNLASANDDPIARKLDETMERAIVGEPAVVRAGPAEDAAMLYAFPKGRELRVVSRNDEFVQIEDVRSGADGWIAKSALASNMMTASIETPKATIRQAKAEIDTPEPVRGIPQKKEWTPMLLGGSESNTASRPTGAGTNFASFVRRGFGAN